MESIWRRLVCLIWAKCSQMSCVLFTCTYWISFVLWYRFFLWACRILLACSQALTHWALLAQFALSQMRLHWHNQMQVPPHRSPCFDPWNSSHPSSPRFVLFPIFTSKKSQTVNQSINWIKMIVAAQGTHGRGDLNQAEQPKMCTRMAPSASWKCSYASWLFFGRRSRDDWVHHSL